MLDITLAPDFNPAQPGADHFYLYYTPAAPELARVARFAHLENAGGLTSTGDLASEFQVWQDTDGYLSCCHYGGGLDFGPDGKLWLTSSDKFTAPNPGEFGPDTNHAQDLTKAGGKVIRMNPDGTVPDGTDAWPANPYLDPIDDDPDLPGNQDYYDYIWAYGLRNPFRGAGIFPAVAFSWRKSEETSNLFRTKTSMLPRWTTRASISAGTTVRDLVFRYTTSAHQIMKCPFFTTRTVVRVPRSRAVKSTEATSSRRNGKVSIFMETLLVASCAT